jgi:hypothetical protein
MIPVKSAHCTFVCWTVRGTGSAHAACNPALPAGGADHQRHAICLTEAVNDKSC